MRRRSNSRATPDGRSTDRGADVTASSRSGCGTGLSLRSAITALPVFFVRRRRILLLDRLAQILFHNGELGHHHLDMLALDAGDPRRHQLLAEVAELFEQRPSLGREEKKLGPAIVGIGPTLD